MFKFVRAKWEAFKAAFRANLAANKAFVAGAAKDLPEATGLTSLLKRRWAEIKLAWSIRKDVAMRLFPAMGAETGNLAGLIVGVILAIVAAVVGINMLPSVITAWVTVSNTTGLDSSAASLTDVGQIVAVVVGIIVAVAVILVVLRISEHAT